MRILHTSDWHIGKRIIKDSRIEEQREVLEEIISICEEQDVEVVVVAGDVFDTYVPKSEAEDLFYEIINKMAGGKRAVIVISGNHDDATRLCASDPLAEKLGIYIYGNVNSVTAKPTQGRKINLVSCGEGYFILQNDKKESVYFATLPYPNEQRFKEKVLEEVSYDQKVKGWLEKCVSANVDGLPVVVVSHIFMAGSVTSESEREIGLGGARAVTKDAIPNCQYVALGHIHKRQVVDKEKNIIYSGSILQYAFDECNSEKSVTIFDIEDGQCKNLNVIPLKKGKKMVRITAKSVSEASKLLQENFPNYVELTLDIGRPITETENKLLVNENPNLIVLRLISDASKSYEQTERRDLLSDKDLFIAYYKSKYNKEPEKAILELYLDCLNEEEEE